MDKEKEMSMLMEQIEPLLNRYSELSKGEMDELGKKTNRMLKLSSQITDELIAKIKKQHSEKLTEYENAIGILEAFIMENGLYEQFVSFSEELVQDFLESQKPNLTLVQ